MSSLQFTSQECFFVVILAFIVIGFMRGWRRELVSLVFVLLAVVLIRPGSNNSVWQVISRIPATIGYFIFGSSSPNTTSSSSLGPWGTLLLFAIVVIIGYLIGNRAFPRPATPAERLIGIIPGVISGAFILFYLVSGGFFARTSQGSSLAVNLPISDPTNYIPIIFVIMILAIIAALIASRAKKAPAKK